MLVNEISVFAMVAALTVIRVGAVFIPNDAKDPASLRLKLIEAAGVTVVMSEEPSVIAAPPEGCTVITGVQAEAADASQAGEPAEYVSADLAAIFFSSGSTGKPKGVMHCANIWFEFVGLHVSATGEQHIMGPEQYSSLESGATATCPVSWCDGFWHGSVTWYSNWTAISDVFNNKIVVIISHETLMDAPALQALRIEHGLTTMYFTPAHLGALVEYQPETLDDLKLVYVWGEKLSSRVINAMAAKQPQIEMLDW
jgi:acyl-coenzyme A synthetase/AMP-(fatty) acid ligase